MYAKRGSNQYQLYSRLTRLKPEPMIYSTRGEPSYHYTTKVVRKFKICCTFKGIVILFIVLFWFIFTDKDDCGDHLCVNGASCVDGLSEYTCTCTPNFTGEYCGTSKWNYYLFFLILSIYLPINIYSTLHIFVKQIMHCVAIL
jgi:hypothetical protein